jgi:hypothetical protein
MDLDPEQKTTFDTIYSVNDEPPEICMEVIDKYMDRIAPNSRGEQPEEPGSNDPWIAHPAVDLDRWQELQPELARETVDALTRSCPHACFESFFQTDAATSCRLDLTRTWTAL